MTEPTRIGAIRVTQQRGRIATDAPEQIFDQVTEVWTGDEWVNVRALVDHWNTDPRRDDW